MLDCEWRPKPYGASCKSHAPLTILTSDLCCAAECKKGKASGPQTARAVCTVFVYLSVHVYSEIKRAS